VRTIESQRW